MVQSTPFPFEALTPSSRRAFEWAAASTGAGNAVGSIALLFGILKSHEPRSEPEQLLAHFGGSRDALLAELAAANGSEVRFDAAVREPLALTDFPPLGEAMQEVLAAALDVWAPTVSEPLPLSALFGGVLFAPQSAAFRALAATLEGAPLDEIRETYPGFIREGDRRPYSAFLNERFPRVEKPRIRIGTLGGAGNDLVAEEDQLGFQDYVDAFADLITSPHTSPPLTIGIFGSWGMGKSFLLEHIERRVCKPEYRAERSTVGAPAVHVVRFNAWEYSATDVVWPGLVRKIVNKLDKDVPWPWYRRFPKRFLWNLKREIPRVRGLVLALGIALAATLFVVAATSRFDVAAIGGALVSALTLANLAKLAQDPLGRWVTALFEESDYGRQIGYMADIKNDLEQLERRLHVRDEQGEDKIRGRVLVIIDDLDRCEPEKAVEVLQAINLLLNFRSFIVCLGIDARIITGAVERYYTGLLDKAGASGYEYLDKIVQIPFRIPEPADTDIKRFIDEQLGKPRPPDRDERAAPTRETELDPQTAGDGAGPAGTAAEPDGVDGERREEQTPPPAEPEIAFTYEELKAFQDLTPFVRPNPRHLKRLVNVYRLVRTLAEKRREDAILANPSGTIRWLVMCGQWPYTAHAMLDEFSEMLERWDGEIPDDAPTDDPLVYLHGKACPKLVPETRDRLDDDEDLLTELLAREDGRLTWDEVRRIRRYTVNFNPAVEEELRAPAVATG